MSPADPVRKALEESDEAVSDEDVAEIEAKVKEAKSQTGRFLRAWLNGPEQS